MDGLNSLTQQIHPKLWRLGHMGPLNIRKFDLTSILSSLSHESCKFPLSDLRNQFLVFYRPRTSPGCESP